MSQAPSTVATQPPMAIVQALRPHQWVKNLLLFVPLAAAHQIHNTEPLTQTALAFAAFCLCASSVYCFNDLMDLKADRAHPTKRYRPFASGALTPAVGYLMSAILLGAAVALALPLGQPFMVVLGGYYLLTLAYSLGLKKVVLLDVIILAILYCVRIIAGHEATGVAYSAWLLAFSLFLFLSLALVKRVSELLNVKDRQESKAANRGYQVEDLSLLKTLGPTSGVLSVLVMVLYINSSDVQVLYQRPEVLWLVCPAMLYWISRIWLLATRGQVHEDPIVFAIKDPVSYLVLLFVGGVVASTAILVN